MWPLSRLPLHERKKTTKLSGKSKSGEARPKTAPVQRPAWDDTINDLTNMRLTPTEQALRAKARLSKHMPSAEAWFAPLAEGPEGGGEENEDRGATREQEQTQAKPKAASAMPRFTSDNPPPSLSVKPRAAAASKPQDGAPKASRTTAAEQSTAELKAAANEPRKKKPTVREILYKPPARSDPTHISFDKEVEDRRLFAQRRGDRAHHKPEETRRTHPDAPPESVGNDRRASGAGQSSAQPPSGSLKPRADLDDSDATPSTYPGAPASLETPAERTLREELARLSRELLAAKEERSQLQQQFEKMTDHSTSMISTLQTQVHAMLTNPQPPVRTPTPARASLLAGPQNYGRSDVEPLPHRPVLGPRDKAHPGNYVEYEDELELPSYGANRAALLGRMDRVLAAPNTSREPPMPLTTDATVQTRFEQQEDGRVQAYSVPTASGQRVWPGPAAASEYETRMIAAYALENKQTHEGHGGYHQPTYLHGGSGPALRDPNNIGLGPAPLKVAKQTFAAVTRSANPRDSFALSVHVAAAMKNGNC